MRSILLVLVLLSACSVFCYKDMGVSFDETMAGFDSANATSYSQGYENGKKAGTKLYFSLTMTAPSAQVFTTNHMMNAVGKIHVENLTPKDGAPTNGTLGLFNDGILNHTLHMHYFLPFIGTDGKQYSLQGIKNILGADCLRVESMMTTLYTTIRTGAVVGQGTVLRMGIIDIPLVGVLELAASVKTVGQGTDADRLNALLEVFGYATNQLEKLCFTESNFEYNFWYVWASQGDFGFLLDLIQQPDQLELRLDIYQRNTSTALVTRQFLPSSAFRQLGNGGVQMGPCTLTSTSCNCLVGSYNVSAAFSLSSRTNRFVPATIENFAKGLLPDIRSFYGKLIAGSTAGNTYPTGLPLTYTTYPIPVGLDLWQWAMISAQTFSNTDLSIEMMALNLADVWLCTSYVFYNGHEHHLDDPFILTSAIETRGEISNNLRIFTGYVRSPSIAFSIKCSADISLFAMLDNEGKTQIHTTVLGNCQVEIDGKIFKGNSALLEVKQITGKNSD